MTTNPPFRFSELLTMEALGARIGKSSEAARKWARRANHSHGLPLKKVGRKWLVDWRDVERLMNEEARSAGAV